MKLLDGKLVSQTLIEKIRTKAAKRESIFRKPKMSILLIGHNPASETYVKNKIKSSESAGIIAELIRFDEDVTQSELISKIEELNSDITCDGMIVQLPLPKQINVNNIISTINPDKDIDGFHPLNFGKMSLGQESFRPATPYGITKLLEHYQIETKGKHCVVIGRSNIVGKPIAIMLGNDFSVGNCTVTLTHIETPRSLLIKQCKMADIVVVAVGIPKFVTKDMIKPGAILIDVGINQFEHRLVGDVDFENVSPICDWITPVPGGVGPMTVAALLLNTYKSYKKNHEQFKIQNTISSN